MFDFLIDYIMDRTPRQDPKSCFHTGNVCICQSNVQVHDQHHTLQQFSHTPNLIEVFQFDRLVMASAL